MAKLPNQLNLKVAILILSSFLPWPSPVHHSFNCPKEQSYLVRNAVLKKWLPIYSRYRVEIPLDCPLHPARDIYHPFHHAKVHTGPLTWSCALCGKGFIAERFLDLHLNNKHFNIITLFEDSVCPAHYCDIIRCDIVQAIELLKSSSNPTNQTITVPKESNQLPVTALAKLSHSSKSLTYSHVTDVCFHDEQQTIHKGWLLPIQHSIVPSPDNNHTKPLMCDSDRGTLKFNDIQGIDEDPLFENLRQQQNQCKEEDFVPLQLKCANVVQICTSGLVLQMTNQEYLNMQGELNRAVCWHLNCRNYWQEIWNSGAHSTLSWLLIGFATAFGAFAVITSYCLACIVSEEKGQLNSAPSSRPTSKMEDFSFDEDEDSSLINKGGNGYNEWDYSMKVRRHVTTADLDEADADAIHIWSVDQQVYDDCLLTSRIKLCNAEDEENSIV